MCNLAEGSARISIPAACLRNNAAWSRGRSAITRARSRRTRRNSRSDRQEFAAQQVTIYNSQFTIYKVRGIATCRPSLCKLSFVNCKLNQRLLDERVLRERAQNLNLFV